MTDFEAMEFGWDDDLQRSDPIGDRWKRRFAFVGIIFLGLIMGAFSTFALWKWTPYVTQTTDAQMSLYWIFGTIFIGMLELSVLAVMGFIVVGVRKRCGGRRSRRRAIVEYY